MNCCGIDSKEVLHNLLLMSTSVERYSIEAVWDIEGSVWLATSRSVPGLVVEAVTWSQLLEEIDLVLPDLLELSGVDPKGVTYTVRAESRGSLTAA